MLPFVPRARAVAPQLFLLSLLAILMPASRAGAGCDNIPSETDVFRSAQGAISAPFAIPGQTMQVRVRPAICDTTSVGLGTPPSCIDDGDVRITVIFEPRDGVPAHAVVMARDCGSAADPASLASRVAAWSSQLGAGASATCQSDSHVEVVTAALESTQECRLDFRFPTATGPALTLPDTMTGPARILVEPIASPLPTTLVTARCADAIAPGQTIACIDELYRNDGSCSTQASSIGGRFPAFTALPIPNDFAAMAEGGASPHPALRFAIDDAGNVLAPMSWSGVLCQNDPSCTFQGFPPPQLVQVLFPQSLGSGLDAAGQPVASGSPLAIPSGEFTSSHTLAGKELPPIFDPSTSSSSLALFGSTDAVQTVIRIQTQAPGRCSGDGRPCISDVGCADSATTQSCDLDAPDQRLADLRYCRHPNACQAPDLAFSPAPVSGGPGLVPSALYAATKGGYVPLEALNLCRNSDELSCVLKNEPLAGDVDANGDGDSSDPSVIELRDRRAGASLPIGFDGISGLATTLLFQSPAAVGPFGQPLIEPPSAPSIRPAVATEGSCAALLFAEPWENATSPLGVDANGDGEAFNPILRVFCRTAPGVIEEVAENGADAAGLGSLLGASIRPLLLASPRTLSPLQGGGEPIVFAGDRLYFLLDELANSPKGSVRMDVNGLGEPALGPASAPTISFGGDVACFTSRSDLLASGSPDTTHFDVYCRDFENGALELVSRQQPSASGGCGDPIVRANASSYKPSLSGDGRLVCFDSDARNLLGAGADANFARDVFVYDRSTCRSLRVSVTASGGESTGASSACSLAGAGGFATFASSAPLVAEDVDTSSDVYLVPLLGGSSDTDPLLPGAPLLLSGGLTGAASAPSLSADGTRVAFELTEGAVTQTVVRDVEGGVARNAVSFHFDGAAPKLSHDGNSLTIVTTDAATHLPTARLVDLVASIARNEPVVEPLALTSTLQDVDAKSFEAAVQTHVATFVSPQPITPLDSPSNVDNEVHVRDLDSGFVKRLGEGTRFPALSGDGSAVAYLQPSSGIPAAIRNGPIPGAEVDFDGGGSSKDTVLAAFDLSTSPPALEVIGAATQVAMDGPVVAFLAPSGEVLVRSCPAGSSCTATALLAPDGVSHARATAVAASASLVCAILSDGAEVACAAPGDAALSSLGVSGRALGIVGDDVVLTTGDQPSHLMVFRRTGGSFVATFTGGPGTRRFVLSENGFAAFERCELDAGADLNGDGVEDECVLEGLDLATHQLFETRATVQPCTLEACDRRFPWRVFPAGVGAESATTRFLSVECQEDGNCGGCTPQSCPVNGRACDLDQDGDCADVVVREFTFGASAPLVLATLAQQVDSDPLAGDASGGVGGQGAVFPTLIGRCDVDTDPATEPSTRPCQTNADCPDGQLCGAPFSALALNDADGDGSFDGFDNCPDTFNPDQADADGNDIGDACQANRCGDAVVTEGERCDDGARNGACAGLTLDQCRALGDAGSFCDASCTPHVFVKTDPAYGGLFPTTTYGTPLLNLGDARGFDGTTCAIPGGCPDSMIDPPSLRLETVPAGGACSGPGVAMYGSYLEDVNHDGLQDRIAKFRVADMGIDPGDTQVCLSGELRAVEGRFDAAPFVARAKLATKRCGFGAELAPILGGLAFWRRRIVRRRKA